MNTKMMFQACLIVMLAALAAADTKITVYDVPFGEARSGDKKDIDMLLEKRGEYDAQVIVADNHMGGISQGGVTVVYEDKRRKIENYNSTIELLKKQAYEIDGLEADRIARALDILKITSVEGN